MMTKRNSRTIENIKTAILVVLSISTILLLYFFWWGESIDTIKFTDQLYENEAPPSIREVTLPDEIIICFGSENYYRVPSEQKDIWDSDSKEKKSMINELETFVQAENILVEEITEKQYAEAMSYKSIQARFSYSIPFTSFCKQYGLKKRQTFGSIEMMTSIGYSDASPVSMFIFDGKNDKYYRLNSYSKHKGLSVLINDIEKGGYDPYFPLGSYLGVENKTIMPISLNTGLSKFNAKQDIYSNQNDKINKIAETFFGESFDFIRKMTEESGTTIFMYGYGEKTLIINPDGSLEYKEKMNDEIYVRQNYFEALDTALQFVQSHGTWNSLNGAKLEPYVKEVSSIPGKYQGYQITFGAEINGGRLFYEAGDIITVEVIGGQVTDYHRNLIDYEKKDLNRDVTQKKEAFSSVNMIAQNYQYINNVLEKSGKEIEGSDVNHTFENVAKLISKVQVGYLRKISKSTSDYEMVPVWIVTAKGVNIYFDLYDATPVSYSGE